MRIASARIPAERLALHLPLFCEQQVAPGRSRHFSHHEILLVSSILSFGRRAALVTCNPARWTKITAPRIAARYPATAEDEPARQLRDDRLEALHDLGRARAPRGIGIEHRRDQLGEARRHPVTQRRRSRRGFGGNGRRGRRCGARRAPAGTGAHPRCSDGALPRDPRRRRAGRSGASLYAALLRSHVSVGADRPARVSRALEVTCDREVDQARWHAHDDVVGLHVEVDVALAVHVREAPATWSASGSELVELEWTAALQQAAAATGPRGARSATCGRGPVERRRRTPGSARGEPGARAPSPPRRVAQRALRVGLVGPQDLGDGQREQLLVPHQEHLVAVAASDRLDHRSARDQLVAFLRPQLA